MPETILAIQLAPSSEIVKVIGERSVSVIIVVIDMYL